MGLGLELDTQLPGEKLHGLSSKDTQHHLPFPGRRPTLALGQWPHTSLPRGDSGWPTASLLPPWTHLTPTSQRSWSTSWKPWPRPKPFPHVPPVPGAWTPPGATSPTSPSGAAGGGTTSWPTTPSAGSGGRAGCRSRKRPEGAGRSGRRRASKGVSPGAWRPAPGLTPPAMVVPIFSRLTPRPTPPRPGAGAAAREKAATGWPGPATPG